MRKDFKLFRKSYGWTSTTGNAKFGARVKKEGFGYSASLYSKAPGTYHLVITTVDGGKVNADYKDVAPADYDEMMNNITELAKVNLGVDLKLSRKKRNKRLAKNEKVLADYGVKPSEIEEAKPSMQPEISMVKITEPPVPEPVEPVPMEAKDMTETEIIEPAEPEYEPIEIPLEDEVVEPIVEERHFAAPEADETVEVFEAPDPVLAMPDTRPEVEPPTTVEPAPEPISLSVETEVPRAKEDDPFVKPMEQDEGDYLPIYMETDEPDYAPAAAVRYGSPAVANVDDMLAAETNKREFQPLRSYPEFPFAGRKTSLRGVNRAIEADNQAIEDVDFQILDEVKTKNGTGYDVEQKFGSDEEELYGLDPRPYVNGNQPPEVDIESLKAQYGKQDLPTAENIKHPLHVSARVAPILLMLGSGIVGYYLLKKLGH